MSPRKYITVLLMALTLCMILTLPLIMRPGNNAVTSGSEDGGPPSLDRASSLGALSHLQVSLSVTEQEFEFWKNKNAQFMAHNPGVHVELVNIPKASAREQWQNGFQLGTAGDIILMDNANIAAFAVSGYLQPLDDFFNGEMLQDHLEAVTVPVKWNGVLWGVPADCNPLLIVWNKELLELAGQSEPPAGWEAFRSLFMKLRSRQPQLQAVGVQPGDMPYILGWMDAIPVQASERGELAGLGSLEGAAAEQLRFLLQVAGDHADTNTAAAAGANGPYRGEPLARLTGREQLSALIGWSEFRKLPVSVRNRLAVSKQISPLLWGGGRSFVIAAQSSSSEAAKKWIQAMTAAEQQKDKYAALGWLPVRKSLYSQAFERYDESYLSPPNWLVPMLDEAAAAVPDPGWAVRWERWSALWEAARPRGQEAAAADRFIAEWNQLFELEVDG